MNLVFNQISHFDVDLNVRLERKLPKTVSFQLNSISEREKLAGLAEKCRALNRLMFNRVEIQAK